MNVSHPTREERPGAGAPGGHGRLSPAGDRRRVEPPRGAGGPQRALRRQHRHLRLGVERLARQALSDHGLQPAPRAGSGQPGPACVQRLPLRVPHRQGREPQGQGWSTASSSRTRLEPEAAPSPDGSPGRRQRAALAAHRRHRDHEGHAPHGSDARKDHARTRRRSSSARISRSSRTTTARRPIGSSTVSAPSRVTTPGIPRAAKWVSTIRRSSTPSSSPCRTAGGSSPASSTIPISSTRRGSSTSST